MPAPDDATPATVLVVDDEAAVVVMVCTHLDRAGVRVLPRVEGYEVVVHGTGDVGGIPSEQLPLDREEAA